MHTMPKMVPISELRNQHLRVFEMAQAQPVILAQHSKPAAVLISVDQWDGMAKRMEELEDYVATQRRMREMAAKDFMTQDQFDRHLVEAGL